MGSLTQNNIFPNYNTKTSNTKHLHVNTTIRTFAVMKTSGNSFKEILASPSKTPLSTPFKDFQTAETSSSSFDVDLQTLQNAVPKTQLPGYDLGLQYELTTPATESPVSKVSPAAALPTTPTKSNIRHMTELASAPFTPPSSPHSVASDVCDTSDTPSCWSNDTTPSTSPSSPPSASPSNFFTTPTKSGNRRFHALNTKTKTAAILQRPHPLGRPTSLPLIDIEPCTSFQYTLFNPTNDIEEIIESGSRTAWGCKNCELTPLQLSHEKKKIMVRKISYHTKDEMQTLVRRYSNRQDKEEEELQRGYGVDVYEKKEKYDARVIVDKQLQKMALYFVGSRVC